MSPRSKGKQVTPRSLITAGLLLGTLLVTGILLTNLLKDMDWTLFRRFGWLDLAWVLLLSMLGTVFYTLGVTILVRSSGYQATFVEIYLILTASLSANYVTPIKAGIPLRIYFYRHFMQIPVSMGTSLVSLETVIGMLLPALISTAGLLFVFESVGLGIPLAFLAMLILAMAMLLFLTPKRLEPLVRHLPAWTFIRRVVNFIGHVQIGFHCVPIRAVLTSAFLFSLNLFTGAVRLHIVLKVLGYDLSTELLLYAITMSVTAGNLSLIPMGLGVRDASLTLILLDFGVPRAIAASIAIIQRLFVPGWPLLLGVISINVLGVRQLSKRLEDVVVDDIPHVPVESGQSNESLPDNDLQESKRT